MNSVNLYGRIANDLELKETKESVYVRFNLAVNDGVDEKGERKTQFIPVICWNATAEAVSDFCKKGDRLLVEGRINNSSYETKEGELRYNTQVIANRIHFVETKEESESRNSSKKSYKRKR